MSNKFTPVCREVTVKRYFDSNDNEYNTKEECVEHEANKALVELFNSELCRGVAVAQDSVAVIKNNAELIRSILDAIGK